MAIIERYDRFTIYTVSRTNRISSVSSRFLQLFWRLRFYKNVGAIIEILNRSRKTIWSCNQIYIKINLFDTKYLSSPQTTSGICNTVSLFYTVSTYELWQEILEHIYLTVLKDKWRSFGVLKFLYYIYISIYPYIKIKFSH